MDSRWSFGIFPKLLLTMILVSVAPLGAVWYLNSRSSLDRLNAEIEQQLSARADALVRSIDEWVDMNLRVLRQNAALEDIASMDGRRQRAILRSITDEYKWTYLAFTVGLNGMNVGRSDQEALRDYSDRVYVKEVLAGKPMGKQVVISRTTGQPSFILSVPITARQQVAGVLALGTSVDDLSRTVTNVRVGGTGYAFLLDEGGSVIGHPTARGNLSAHPAFRGLGGETKKRLEYADPASGKPIVAYAQKTKHGWITAVQQDRNEAYAPIAAANRNALITLAVTLVCVGLVSYAVAQRLTRPIRNLTTIAENISRGKLDASIGEASRSDEIGGLARAIERLRVGMRLALERLARR